MDAAAVKRRVAQNLAEVEQRIEQAAGARQVELVCVTKYAQAPWMEALLEAGATNLAENLLPSATERFNALREKGYRFTRHLIGPQQSRKLKQIPGKFEWLQALDRMDSAVALAGYLHEAAIELDVLVQVNIGRETQKHGCLPEEAPEWCARLLAEPSRLRLRGLMAIPPWPSAYGSEHEFEQGSRECFRQMYELFAKIRNNHPTALFVDTLSMGMSQDYVWAIAEGATMVRVGSALFAGLEG